MSASEQKETKEIPEEEPEETNPYKVAVISRRKNIAKRIRNAEALQQKQQAGEPLQPNQLKAIGQLDHLNKTVQEFDELTNTFSTIDDLQRKARAEELENNLTAIVTALLLPSFLSSEAKEERAKHLTQSEGITPSHLDLLCTVRDYLIPQSIEQPLAAAVAERVEFFENLLNEVEDPSPVSSRTFNEIKQALTLLSHSQHFSSLPKEKKPNNRKKTQPANKVPAAPPPPEEEKPQTEKPAPTVETKKPEKAQEQKQETEKQPQTKPEDKKQQRKRKNMDPSALRYVPNSDKSQEQPQEKSEKPQEKPEQDHKPKNQKQPTPRSPKSASKNTDPFHYNP